MSIEFYDPSARRLHVRSAKRQQHQQVTEPVPIEKHPVYVIPPGKDLSMNDGYLRLTDPQARRGPHTSIDLGKPWPTTP